MPVLDFFDFQNMDLDQAKRPGLKIPTLDLKPETSQLMENGQTNRYLAMPTAGKPSLNMPVLPNPSMATPPFSPEPRQASPVPQGNGAPSEARSLMQRGQMSNALAVLAKSIGPNSFGGRLGEGVIQMNQQNVANARQLEHDELLKRKTEGEITERGLDIQTKQRELDNPPVMVNVPGIGTLPADQAYHYMDKPESQFSKVDPGDFKPDSIKAFQDSAKKGEPDYSLLTPVDDIGEKSQTVQQLIARSNAGDETAKATLKSLQDYQVNTAERKASVTESIKSKREAEKEEKKDKQTKLKDLKSNFSQAIGRANSAKMGVNITSEMMGEQQGVVAQQEYDRAKNLAVEFVQEGGDPKELGLVTRETQMGTFIQTGPDEWTRVK